MELVTMKERLNKKVAPASFNRVQMLEWGDFDSPNPNECGYEIVADGITLFSCSFGEELTPNAAIDRWLDEYCDDVESEPDTLEALNERLLAYTTAAG